MVLTEEHCLKMKDNLVGVYNLELYKYVSGFKIKGNNELYGTYKLDNLHEVIKVKDGYFRLEDSLQYDRLVECNEFDECSKTYTLIVDGCNWCICNGVTIACARKVD